MPSPRIPLRDLVTNGTPIFPHEAAAVVQEVCSFVAGQDASPRAVPALDRLMIDADGRLLPNTTVTMPDEDLPAHLGQLLRDLLGTAGFPAEPGFGERLQRIADGAVERRVSVDAFREAVGRLDPTWRADFLRELYERGARHRAAAQPESLDATPGAASSAASDTTEAEAADAVDASPRQPLVPTSIDDFAALRTANGVSLDAVAQRTKIGTPLLRDLEQGSLRRWPGGVYRRSWIRAYAVESGLNPDAVLRLLEPVIKAADGEDTPPPSTRVDPPFRRSLFNRLVGLF
jgi:hypothetical protein